MSPADQQGKGKRQRIVDIDIQFIIPICGFKRFDEEKIIKDYRDKRPDYRYETIIPKRVAVHFPYQHPKRRKSPDRHDDPPDERKRYDGKKHDAKRITQEPEEKSPPECVCKDLSIHTKTVSRRIIFCKITKL